MVRLVCRWSCCSIVHRQITVSLHHRFHLQLEGLFFTGHLHSSPALTVLQLKVAMRWKPLNTQTVPFLYLHKSAPASDTTAKTIMIILRETSDWEYFFLLCWRSAISCWLMFVLQLKSARWKGMSLTMFDRMWKCSWITLSKHSHSWQATISGVTWFGKALKNSSILHLLPPKRYFSKLKHRSEKRTSQAIVPALTHGGIQRIGNLLLLTPLCA